MTPLKVPLNGFGGVLLFSVKDQEGMMDPETHPGMGCI